MAGKRASSQKPTFRKPNMQSRWRGFSSHHQVEAKKAWRRLWQQPISSVMTWLVIAIGLALPALLYVVINNVQSLSNGWQQEQHLSLFLQIGVADSKAEKLTQQLQLRPEVLKASYQSPKQSLTEFKAESGFGEALNYLQDNPLPGVINVQLKLASGDWSGMRNKVKEFEMLPAVESAQFDLQWLQRLHAIVAVGERFALLLGFVLAVAVVLIIGNTIRMNIEARRAEIVVVKLVGGTNAYVRRPFLYTGLWLGIGGALLAWLLVTLLLLLWSGQVAELMSLYSSDFSLSGLGFLASIILLIAGAVLGLCGAWLAVSRHLSDIEPR